MFGCNLKDNSICMNMIRLRKFRMEDWTSFIKTEFILSYNRKVFDIWVQLKFNVTLWSYNIKSISSIYLPRINLYVVISWLFDNDLESKNSLFHGISLFLVTSLGYCWQYGEVQVKSTYVYRAESEFSGTLAMFVGLRRINITLSGTNLYPSTKLPINAN